MGALQADTRLWAVRTGQTDVIHVGYFWARFLRLITFEALAKSLKSRHSREGGSPEALEKTGFPPTRE